jgi:hypothetical protein
MNDGNNKNQPDRKESRELRQRREGNPMEEHQPAIPDKVIGFTVEYVTSLFPGTEIVNMRRRSCRQVFFCNSCNRLNFKPWRANTLNQACKNLALSLYFCRYFNGLLTDYFNVLVQLSKASNSAHFATVWMASSIFGGKTLA